MITDLQLRVTPKEASNLKILEKSLHDRLAVVMEKSPNCA